MITIDEMGSTEKAFRNCASERTPPPAVLRLKEDNEPFQPFRKNHDLQCD
jgi:hypothetical protein